MSFTIGGLTITDELEKLEIVPHAVVEGVSPFGITEFIYDGDLIAMKIVHNPSGDHCELNFGDRKKNG